MGHKNSHPGGGLMSRTGVPELGILTSQSLFCCTKVLPDTCLAVLASRAMRDTSLTVSSDSALGALLNKVSTQALPMRTHPLPWAPAGPGGGGSDED